MKKFIFFLLIPLSFYSGWKGSDAYRGLDKGITQTYKDVAISDYKENEKNFIKYISQRDSALSDLAAFEVLGMLSSSQFDGKYTPWLVTDIGFVLFDEDGYVDKVCPLPDYGDYPCPENL